MNTRALLDQMFIPFIQLIPEIEDYKALGDSISATVD